MLHTHLINERVVFQRRIWSASANLSEAQARCPAAKAQTMFRLLDYRNGFEPPRLINKETLCPQNSSPSPSVPGR
jgi:hypothetical protein